MWRLVDSSSDHNPIVSGSNPATHRYAADLHPYYRWAATAGMGPPMICNAEKKIIPTKTNNENIIILISEV